MAKDKEKEALYKAEYKKRVKERYIERWKKGQDRKRYKRAFDHWEDSDSPTGWSQHCDYQGICQYPCCGDC